jgi:hypothetical protein
MDEAGWRRERGLPLRHEAMKANLSEGVVTGGPMAFMPGGSVRVVERPVSLCAGDGASSFWPSSFDAV